MSRRARLTFEPLADWPYPATTPIRAPFSARWTSTRDLLLAEADHLGADLVVVELDLTRNHLRNDGEIRANARPTSGRARLTMDTRHGSLRYAVDRYAGNGDVQGWQANLRAIALTLQALRAVDRYGAVHDAEGAWPTDMPLRDVVRAARAVWHPDRCDGDRTRWDQLERATGLMQVAGLLGGEHRG